MLSSRNTYQHMAASVCASQLPALALSVCLHILEMYMLLALGVSEQLWQWQFSWWARSQLQPMFGVLSASITGV